MDFNLFFSQKEEEDAGGDKSPDISEDDMSEDDSFELDIMNDNGERQDVAYAELMLAEFDKQPFYHKYWGRRRTEPFKHSSKMILDY